MSKIAKMWLLVLLAVCGMAAAQEKEQPTKAAAPSTRAGFYRLDFVLKETEDGTVLNTRNYSTLVMSDTPGRRESFVEVKSGSRVPISSDKGTVYMDVGVLFNGRLTETDDNTLLLKDLSVEISSLAPAETTGFNPVVRMMRATVSTPLSPGKATTLCSVDDPNSKHRFMVEVTATKLK